MLKDEFISAMAAESMDENKELPVPYICKDQDIPVQEDEKTSIQKEVRIVKRKAVSLGDSLERHHKEPPTPLIIPAIKDVSFGFIFGPPKSGKTIYCEHLLLSIAAGRTMFNGYLLQCSNRKCLFVSYEENTRGRNERNKKQLHGFSVEEQEAILQNYVVSNQEMPKYVLAGEDWQALEDEIVYYKPGMVVIDSLSRLTMESNSEEEVAKTITKRLQGLVIKHKCTIIVINHTTKGKNESPLTINSMSGSRIYSQEAEFIIGINKTISNTRYIKIVCARHDKDDYDTVDTFDFDEHLCIKIKGKEYEGKVLAVYDGRRDSSNTEVVYQAIDPLMKDADNDEFNTSDLKHLYEKGLMSKETFFKALENLCEDGKIKRLSRGKYQCLVR